MKEKWKNVSFNGTALSLHYQRNSFLNFCFWYNACDAAMLLRRQACGAAGKRCDGNQFLFCQIRRILVQLQEAAHSTSAENISGTGGIHNMDPGR